MIENMPHEGAKLLSVLEADGSLRLELAKAEVAQPGDDQVVIRIEAAPINPSDIMAMFVSADPQTARFSGSAQNPVVSLQLTPQAAQARAIRHGRPVGAGLSAAGTVIAAGRNAERMLGRKVSALSLDAGMFAQYATVNAAECALLPQSATTKQGADVFCNPMTALAIVEAAKLAGSRALIHTAAASNLGRMLVRICQEDYVPLVNIVRRQEQADLLRSIGAAHVCVSSDSGFRDDLRRAIAATGATIAFDALGGGAMAGELLRAMEDAACARMSAYSPYGSSEFKQVFIYGHLDPSPIVLGNEGYGMYWSLRNWAMPETLAKIGAERTAGLRSRILDNLTTTFASTYAREISLAQVLHKDTMLAFARQATGEKYLINPMLQRLEN